MYQGDVIQFFSTYGTIPEQKHELDVRMTFVVAQHSSCIYTTSYMTTAKDNMH